MRKVFPGHFRPNSQELNKLWDQAIFVVDANVLLNLYRYSQETRVELEKALRAINGRLFITNQAAKEFLKNRLVVTSGQAKEYTTVVETINNLVKKLSSKDRHPFIGDKELPQFKEYTEKLIGILDEQQIELHRKFTEDEILDFVDEVFHEKTGAPFSKEEKDVIAAEGEHRYQSEIPPGYKDLKKEDKDDPYRKFGDLFVWKQTIKHAKENEKPVIFITDDKKEDWWQEQSGRTIGPRPELIEEFISETNHGFWMYTVDRFLKESGKKSNTKVSEDVLSEIVKLSEELSKRGLEIDNNKELATPSISVSQETLEGDLDMQSGLLIVTLNHDMRYATGTGKFSPKFNHIPDFQVNLVNSPNEDTSNIGISFGCGTTINFNVHLKARTGVLVEGDYIFKYEAVDKNNKEFA